METPVTTPNPTSSASVSLGGHGTSFAPKKRPSDSNSDRCFKFSGQVASSPSALTPAERAARIDAMIAKMGYVSDEIRQQRTRRAGPGRKKPTP